MREYGSLVGILTGLGLTLEVPVHLIGSPLAFATEEFAPKFWQKFDDIPALKTAPGIRCVHGTVQSVDCENKTAKIVNAGTKKVYEEKYDFLVVASGLRRVWPTVPQSLTREDYLSEVLTHIESVKNSENGVVVIGGGT